jgi:very-short-patch-repair endonuclease
VPGEFNVRDVIRPKLQSRALDHEIAELAGGQHGVVALRQLVERGASRRAVGRRIERRQLSVVHWGVYAAQSTPLTEEGRIMAAVLAGGAEAVASHHAAARLRDLPVPAAAEIHVTVPRILRPRAGIRFHRRSLPRDEVDAMAGIPTTTTARALFDLAEVLPPHRVEKAVDQAEYRRLTDVVALPALIDRYPGHRGNAALREILASQTLGEDRTESELEDGFREFLRKRCLPAPRQNVPMVVGGMSIRPDCVWPQQRLIVELDGRPAHERRRAFESDRARDRRLQVAGWRVVRITWAQLLNEPDQLERDLRALLSSIPRHA